MQSDINQQDGASEEEPDIPVNDTAEEATEGSENEETMEETEELDPQAQLEADLLKWKETAMRSAAELENFRKRMAREKIEAIKFGNQRLIEELLPVIDSFTMGMMAAEQEAESMVYMGMKMVQAQLESFLESQDVKEAETVIGSDFDPNIHDAMSQEASAEHEDGKIIRVMRKGYLLGDRLIRPANVVVSKSEADCSEETVEEEDRDNQESE